MRAARSGLGRTGLVLAALGVLLGQFALAACDSGSESGCGDCVELQLTNNTSFDGYTVSAAVGAWPVEGSQSYEMEPAGDYSTWTKIDASIFEGQTVYVRLFFTEGGMVVAEGACRVSDAQDLGYARIEFGPEVSCNCGFEGTTGCEPSLSRQR